MTEYRRNVAVGITVLAALIGLGYIILLFGEAPAFAKGGYKIWLNLPQAGGIVTSADVYLNGMRVGTVADVSLRPDPREGVRIECRINRDVRIPADVAVSIASAGFGGSAHVALTAWPLQAGQPWAGWLADDDSAELTGTLPAGGLIDRQTREQLDKIATSLESFSRSAEKLNRVLDSLYAITGDADNQANIAAALDNIRVTTARSATVMEELRQFVTDAGASIKKVDDSLTKAAEMTVERINAVAGKVMENADQIGQLLSSLNQAAGNISEGKGTAGKLLNDPQLYNNLLESTRQASLAMAELQAMIKVWRAEGVRVNLK
ncbi:MAG: MCE family protein [Planctomycetes bacterium]|nr:MCE family protein [Planctomycetota bacterium]